MSFKLLSLLCKFSSKTSPPDLTADKWEWPGRDRSFASQRGVDCCGCVTSIIIRKNPTTKVLCVAAVSLSVSKRSPDIARPERSSRLAHRRGEIQLIHSAFLAMCTSRKALRGSQLLWLSCRAIDWQHATCHVPLCFCFDLLLSVTCTGHLA